MHWVPFHPFKILKYIFLPHEIKLFMKGSEKKRKDSEIVLQKVVDSGSSTFWWCKGIDWENRNKDYKLYAFLIIKQ